MEAPLVGAGRCGTVPLFGEERLSLSLSFLASAATQVSLPKALSVAARYRAFLPAVQEIS